MKRRLDKKTASPKIVPGDPFSHRGPLAETTSKGWTMSRRGVIVAVVLYLSFTRGGRADEPAKGEKYALLVGVQKYSEEKVLRPLPYSERDVTDLAQVLRDNGYKADNVVLMTQTAASDDLRYLPLKARILKELRLLLADRSDDDTVLLAFAGHGVHFSDDKNSYFCPADALLEDRATLLPLGDVYAELEKCKAGVKVLLVDACRNDPFKDPTRAAKVDLDSVTRPEVPEPPKGVVAFFSCSEKEKAYEDEKLGHGVFFHFVIQGLNGEAASDQGEVTLLGLSDYVVRNVSDHVRAAYGKTQKPEIIGRSSGAAALIRMDEAALDLRKGKALLANCQYDEAADALSAALKLDPDRAGAYACRGLADLERLRFDEALDDCEHALKLDPKLALAFAVRGLTYIQRKHDDPKRDHERAASDADAAVRLDPALALAYACRARTHGNDYELGLEDAGQAVTLEPASPYGYMARGNLYYYRAPEKALDEFAAAVRVAPLYAPAHKGRGDVYHYVLKDDDKAIQEYSECLRLDPRDVNAYTSRAICYISKGDFDRELDDLSQAILLSPNDPALYTFRGGAYMSKKEYDKAIADCTHAIRLDPNYAPAYMSRASAYLLAGDQASYQADRSKADQLMKK